MNYIQVDNAITFLTLPNVNYIVLQVPYSQDIKLVQRYLLNKLGYPSLMRKKSFIYAGKEIYFEAINTGLNGRGHKINQLFFIDRQRDRSYMDLLE